MKIKIEVSDDTTTSTITKEFTCWTDVFPDFLNALRGAGFYIDPKVAVYMPGEMAERFGSGDEHILYDSDLVQGNSAERVAKFVSLGWDEAVCEASPTGEHSREWYCYFNCVHCGKGEHTDEEVANLNPLPKYVPAFGAMDTAYIAAQYGLSVIHHPVAVEVRYPTYNVITELIGKEPLLENVENRDRTEVVRELVIKIATEIEELK